MGGRQTKAPKPEKKRAEVDQTQTEEPKQTSEAPPVEIDWRSEFVKFELDVNSSCRPESLSRALNAALRISSPDADTYYARVVSLVIRVMMAGSSSASGEVGGDSGFLSSLAEWATAHCGGPVVCGHVFEAGERVYSCRTCAVTSNSALCEECFVRDEGRHATHDYRSFVLESSGGCCDCSDPVQLKPEAFCSKHSRTDGKSSSSAAAVSESELIPVQFRDGTRLAMESVMSCLADALGGGQARPGAIRAVADGVRQIADSGGMGVQAYAGAALSESGRLGALLLAYNTLPIEARRSLHLMILKLVSSKRFKLALADEIVRNYSKFPLPAGSAAGGPAALDADSDFEDVLSLTAQVLPVVDIMLGVLSRDDLDLPGTFTQALENVFAPFLDAGSGVYTRLQNETAKSRCWRTAIEVREACRSPQCAELFLRKSAGRPAVDRLLRVLTAFQGTAPDTRRTTGDPEPFAFVAHTNVLMIEHGLGALSWGLAKAIRASEPGLGASVIQSAAAALVRWRGLPAAVPVVSGTSVSLHLPLTRAIAGFITAFLQRNQTATLEDLFGSTAASLLTPGGAFAEAMLMPPLRAQVFVSQARANMWVRNGPEIVNWAEAYRSIVPHEFFFPDFLALQIACAVVGPQRFVAAVLDAFGWPEVSEELIARAEPENVRLLEDAVALLVLVASDRTHATASAEDVVRREVINNLCPAPAGYSFLVERVREEPFAEHVPAKIEQVLQEVATYTQARTSGMGAYFQLNPQFWREFDPYFLHFSMHAREKAEERFAATPLASAPRDPPPPPLRALEALPLVLGDDRLAAVARAVIGMQVRGATKPRQSLLARCLDVIERAKLMGSWAQYESIVPDLRELQGELTGPLLHTLKRMQVVVEPEPGKDSPVQAKDARARARERQAALLEKFRREQQAFLQKSEDAPAAAASATPVPAPTLAEGATPVPPTKDPGDQVCILCREEIDLSNAEALNSKPAGLAVHVQVTKIMEHVRKQAEAAGHGSCSWASGAAPTSAAGLPDVHVASCSHMMHFSCFSGYLQGQSLQDAGGRYPCPLCHRFSNGLLPIVPASAVTQSREMNEAIDAFSMSIFAEVDGRAEAPNATACVLFAFASTLTEVEHSLRFPRAEFAPVQRAFLSSFAEVVSSLLRSRPSDGLPAIPQPLLCIDPLVSAVSTVLSLPAAERSAASSILPALRRAYSLELLRSSIVSTGTGALPAVASEPAALMGLPMYIRSRITGGIASIAVTPEQRCASISKRLSLLSSIICGTAIPETEIENVDALSDAAGLVSHAIESGMPIVCPPPGLPTLSLAPLPHEYATVLRDHRGRKCRSCGTVPKGPALCLLCGELICAASPCCTDGEIGECTAHTLRCSATGAFLFLAVSAAIIVNPLHGGPWIALLFLNAHGEEDIGQKRGDPLFLDSTRYSQLAELFSNHSFDGVLPTLPNTGPLLL